MMMWLGLFCLAWTTLELGRLARAAAIRREAMASLGAEPLRAARAEASTGGAGRFAAWDDDGRAIHVEDLGGR